MIKFIRKCVMVALTRPQYLSILTMVGIGCLASLYTPGVAYADFDLTNAGKSVLGFFQLLILLATAKMLTEYIGRGHVVPAIIIAIAGATFCVIIDPDLMKEIGNGFKALLKMNGSSHS